MTVHRFFVADDLVAGHTASLGDRQSKQVHSVLRLGTGDRIALFNGSGIEADARLIEVNRGEARFVVDSVSYPPREPDVSLTVGLALLRGDRFEIAIQKLTEIGVRRIVPLAAERCVATYRDASDWNKRAARYERIMIEALEQSERVTSVELAPPATVEDFLADSNALALVERGEHESLATVPIRSALALAVGPEGGWSESELRLIAEYAETASLGKLILRAETAAIVAAGTVIQRSYTSNDVA